MQQSAQASVIL